MNLSVRLCNMAIVIFLALLFNWLKYSLCLEPNVSGYFADISGGVEYEDGDVIISGLFDLHKYDESTACGSAVDISGTYRALAFAYAVDEVNKRTDILPNVKLGYVFLDCCKKGTTSLARSLYTVPDKRWRKESCPAVDPTCQGGFDYFPIVGSVGPQSSLIARLTTAALGLFHIPQISNYVTSDEFSSREKYPYFLRTVPPDRFQVVAMKSILVKFGWSYISVVYEDGYYGRAAVKALDDVMRDIGACFAVKEMVDHATTTAQWNSIVDRIIDNASARIVILFLYSKPTMTFIEAMRRRNAQDQFIIIVSDSVSVLTATPKYMDILPQGLLGTSISAISVPEFDEYFQSIDAAQANKSMIVRHFWESVFSCSLSYGASNACDPKMTFKDSGKFASDPLASVVIDSVNVMATGIDDVIKEKCPGVHGKALRDCVTGPDLILKLRNTTYRGHTGAIRFNENGDLIGHYDIVNIQRKGGKNKAEFVARYDVKTDTLNLSSDTRISWPDGLNSSRIPESVCSKPCRPGEQRIQWIVKCCWDCRPCRENEYTTENASKCVQCKDFSWPDQKDFKTCLEIEPVVLEWHDIECIAVIVLTGFGLALTLVIFALFTRYKDAKLLKASSIELMYVILVAVFWSLLMVFSFLSYPDDVTCYANFFGFNISFAASYAPLLVKTRRIYAIFASGRKTAKAPPAISSQSQIIICLLLVFVQVVICVIIAVVDKPFPRKLMPVPTIKMVELSCHVSPVIILVPLCYNLVLVIACTIFAFKTRGIPANFRESRFISFSVYTTLVLWVALIPTYYTANTERYKVIYLTLAMIIHVYVIHVCLFLPKLYAVMYLKEADIMASQGRLGSSHSNGPAMIGLQGIRGRCDSRDIDRRHCNNELSSS